MVDKESQVEKKLLNKKPMVVWDTEADFRAFGFHYSKDRDERVRLMNSLGYVWRDDVWRKEAKNSLSKFLE